MKITHKDFIGVYDEVVSLEDCNNIIKVIEHNLNLNSPGNDIHSGDTQFHNRGAGRKDYSFYPERLIWINELINQTLQQCLEQYSNVYFTINNLANIRSDEIKLQKTPPHGGYHVWHCEQSNKQMGSRVLAWTLYLNDIPEGEGETEYIMQGARIQPKAGRMCIFPAAWTHTHRGNPVYSKDKYIATGWFSFIE
jgi:hypothetical protein